MPDDKAQKIAKFFENPDMYATSEEMAQIIARILRELRDTKTGSKKALTALEKKFESGTLRDLRQDMDAFKRQARDDARALRDMLGGEDGPALRDEIERLEDLIDAIPRPQSSEKIIGDALRRFREEMRPDYAEDVRTKLEYLIGDDRLDISAVKGTDELLEKYWQANMNRAIEILDRRTQYLINKQTTSSGGGGTGGTGTWYAVTGTIDGSNATFTLAVTPASDFMLVLGGQVQIPIKWYTVSGATITYQAGYVPVGIPTDEHKAFVIS